MADSPREDTCSQCRYQSECGIKFVRLEGKIERLEEDQKDMEAEMDAHIAEPTCGTCKNEVSIALLNSYVKITTWILGIFGTAIGGMLARMLYELFKHTT